jgi:hypothetical protein
MVLDGSSVFARRKGKPCYEFNQSNHAISGHRPFYSTIKTLAFRVLAEHQKEKKT